MTQTVGHQVDLTATPEFGVLSYGVRASSRKRADSTASKLPRRQRARQAGWRNLAHESAPDIMTGSG